MTSRKPIQETGFHAMIRRIVAEELAEVEAKYRRDGLTAYADLAAKELATRSEQ